jgi:hypothetical protein
VSGALAVRQSGSVLAGLTGPLLVALEQLGINDFNKDVSNCLGEDMATSPAIAPKGLGAKPPRNCTPGAADEASQIRRRR